jgi:DNA (cytosine-5)-methyltransferase 1
MSPDYAIIENVGALRGKGLAALLKDLWAFGYDAEWHIIPSSAIGGFSSRERLWIVAYPTSFGVEEPIIKWGEPLTDETKVARFSDGWVSERATEWIRSSVIPEGNAIPRRLASDALKQYGNAVDPNIPEFIGRQLLAHQAARETSSNAIHYR